MQRSTLQPLRTRRQPLTHALVSSALRREKLTPATVGTRKTIAALGTLWLAFAGAKHSA